jgi:hypothetical protein
MGPQNSQNSIKGAFIVKQFAITMLPQASVQVRRYRRVQVPILLPYVYLPSRHIFDWAGKATGSRLNKKVKFKLII